jgi:NADH-quinone oxidoreductase subunit J
VVAQNIAFGIIAAAMVIAAIRVVTTKNVIHAALYLIVVLAGVGAQFVLLAAEFIAIVQVIVYIGAIVVIFLFGIMLTRAPIGREVGLDNRWRGTGLVVAALFLGVLCYALVDTFADEKVLEEGVEATIVRTGNVGDSLFAGYLVPFEAAGALLLAALVGAIVIARRD